MMNQKGLESLKNSTLYLERLETWYLLRWKRRLELLQETTEDLWLLRKVLKERRNTESGIIAFVEAKEFLVDLKALNNRKDEDKNE